MRKLKKPKNLLQILLFCLCASVVIAVPVMASLQNKGSADTHTEMSVLNVWQIDSFEGGKGSRASYLQSIGDDFAKKYGCYIKVTALTSTAAKENLKLGNVPDLISFGAGICGIESYICGQTPFYTWCYGGYCMLSIEEGADFSDITTENTVINGGTENLSDAAALLCGVNGADVEKPTGAYVKLINGKYKYLLGTQRDIFRLKTRGVAFSVKPITEFNDLYQNISVTTQDSKKKLQADNYIKFLLSNSEKISKLGLMASGLNLYDDEMRAMEGLNYDCTLISPTSEQTKNQINSAIINNDIKKLKNLII